MKQFSLLHDILPLANYPIQFFELGFNCRFCTIHLSPIIMKSFFALAVTMATIACAAPIAAPGSEIAEGFPLWIKDREAAPTSEVAEGFPTWIKQRDADPGSEVAEGFPTWIKDREATPGSDAAEGFPTWIKERQPAPGSDAAEGFPTWIKERA